MSNTNYYSLYLIDLIPISYIYISILFSICDILNTDICSLNIENSIERIQVRVKVRTYKHSCSRSML